MTRRLNSVLGLFLAGAVFWACADIEAPTAPDAAPEALAPQFSHGNSSDTGPDLTRIARFERSGVDTLYIGIAQKWICSDGGSIAVFGFEAIFPEGAVDECTKVTIKLDVDRQRKKQQDHVVAEFKPHGVHFNVPVTIRLPYQNTTAAGDEDSSVLWWDGAEWVEYPTTFTDDGRIETQTDHFSEWGTEDSGYSGGILTGGG